MFLNVYGQVTDPFFKLCPRFSCKTVSVSPLNLSMTGMSSRLVPVPLFSVPTVTFFLKSVGKSVNLSLFLKVCGEICPICHFFLKSEGKSVPFVHVHKFWGKLTVLSVIFLSLLTSHLTKTVIHEHFGAIN